MLLYFHFVFINILGDSSKVYVPVEVMHELDNKKLHEVNARVINRFIDDMSQNLLDIKIQGTSIRIQHNFIMC